MVRLWNSVLEQYGQTVTLRREDETVPVKAFFQPVAEKAPGMVPTALGMASAGKYLYLGPAETGLEDVEELGWDGRAFRILRSRDYLVGDELIYRWAVCEEMDAQEVAAS